MAKATKTAATAAKKPAPDDFDGYDVLIANGTIEHKLYAEVAKVIAEHRKSKKVIVALVTYGGHANAGYRIGRLLQLMYEDVVVFVPSLCKSAGTLIAAAGNRLIISPFGEIGPLDVQLMEKDEIGERKSGLTIRSALEDLKSRSFDLFEHFMMEMKKNSGNAISFKLAAEIASGLTASVMSSVYEQIHPDVLGKDYRDLGVATEYGERLNRKFKNAKDNGISRLVHEYPSHDFVIDFEEAKEIFERVDTPSERLWDLIDRHRNLLTVPKVNSRVVQMETWGPAAAAANNGANDEDGSGTTNSAVKA